MKHANRSMACAGLMSLAALGSLWHLNTATGSAQEPAVRIEPRVPLGAPASGGADRLSATIRVNSDLVLIPVLVTDRDNRAIAGLERAHFRLWEDKREQMITHFQAEDAPISVVFAFDVSGSMARKLRLAKLAVDQFLTTANPEDEFAVVAFNDRAQLMQSFTTNHEQVQNRMMLLQCRGSTALLDAVVLSMNEVKHAKNSRKVILIISDGGDNNSRFSYGQVRSRIREADVQIYSVAIDDPQWLRGPNMQQFEGAALLNDIASQSGGRLYEIDDPNELPDLAVKIGTALRNQYVLGYVPPADRRDGKYHRVKVTIQRPAGVPPLRASFRSGYTAPSN